MSRFARRGRTPRYLTARTATATVATLTLALLGTTAHAASEAAGVASDGKAELAPVVVRARLAEESIRDVPFSVDVVTGQAIDEQRQPSLQDALLSVPGVEINDGGGDTWNANIRIRGVGALQKVSGEDTLVGLSVDGVAMPISNLSATGFDLEHVEVLKGPQGTLFGSNSEAGTVNIITARPTREFESWFRTEIGTGRHRMVEGAISGPLSPTLSARLAVRGQAGDNGVRDYQSGQPIGRARDTGVRGTLLWTPWDSTRLTLTAQHDSLRGHPNLYVLRPYGDPPTMDRGTIPWQNDSRRVDRVGATVEHDLGPMLLTSITGYVKADTWMMNIPYEGNAFRQLLGEVPQDAGYFVMANDETNLSQELRLSSRPRDSVFWVAGVNWQHADRHVDMPYGGFDSSYPGSTVNATTRRQIKTISRAVFGEVTVPVAERLKLTGGLRHTRDSKTYQASWQAAPGNPNPIRYAEDSGALEDSFTTGRVALSWALSDESNLYTVASRGYKSGGFNDSGTNVTMGLHDAPYRAARVNAFEVGFKHARKDGRLGLNGALFHARSKGDHLLFFDTMTFAMYAENVDTRSRGAELSGFWKPGGGLTLRAGLAWTDAKITGVPAESTTGAASGNRVPDSPKLAATLSAEHRQPLGALFGGASLTLNSRVDARFAGNRSADPQNSFTLPGYNQVNLRLGISDASTEVYLWVSNLTNKRYDRMGYYYPAMYEGGQDAQLGSPSRGRLVGIGLSHYF